MKLSLFNNTATLMQLHLKKGPTANEKSFKVCSGEKSESWKY